MFLSLLMCNQMNKWNRQIKELTSVLILNVSNLETLNLPGMCGPTFKTFDLTKVFYRLRANCILTMTVPDHFVCIIFIG